MVQVLQNIHNNYSTIQQNIDNKSPIFIIIIKTCGGNSE